jgi:hypothetical protein
MVESKGKGEKGSEGILLINLEGYFVRILEGRAFYKIVHLKTVVHIKTVGISGTNYYRTLESINA